MRKSEINEQDMRRIGRAGSPDHLIAKARELQRKSQEINDLLHRVGNMKYDEQLLRSELDRLLNEAEDPSTRPQVDPTGANSTGAARYHAAKGADHA